MGPKRRMRQTNQRVRGSPFFPMGKKPRNVFINSDREEVGYIESISRLAVTSQSQSNDLWGGGKEAASLEATDPLVLCLFLALFFIPSSNCRARRKALITPPFVSRVEKRGNFPALNSLFIVSVLSFFLEADYILSVSRVGRLVHSRCAKNRV